MRVDLDEETDEQKARNRRIDLRFTVKKPSIAELEAKIEELRLVGDDARYVQRPGPTSPPFPGHGMRGGYHWRDGWLPVRFTRPYT